MTIKEGDVVIWRGGWGTQSPKKAIVVRMELCENEREKYGELIDAIDLKDKNRAVFSLDNGHWAYGYQIEVVE